MGFMITIFIIVGVEGGIRKSMINTHVQECPNCQKEIHYKRIYEFKIAEFYKTTCGCCRAKLNAKKYNYKERFSGSNNPFYGRKHTKETIAKIVSKTKGRKLIGAELEKSRKTIELARVAKKGKGNYALWIEKYGKEKADLLYKEWTKKLSLSRKGEKNNMYGHSPPIGSGNGIGSWYRGLFFRSLKELQYYIQMTDETKNKCILVNKKIFRINYIDKNGINRTYLADFFINNKFLIEIKPKDLWKTDEVKRKARAAVKFCMKNNFIYKLIDIKLNLRVLEQKYLNKEIVFIDKYKIRFEKYLKK